MKVVLAGVTGFIGSEVLSQCLSNPAITSIIALSRRDLPATATTATTANDSSKLKVVILKDDDFLSYPDSVLQDFRGAQACIWCLGKAYIPNNETARKVSVDYTMAAVKAFASVLPSDSDQARKFRFVYLSGRMAERDQTKSLWVLQEYRRVRGEVENVLLTHEKENSDKLESYVVRAGMVLKQKWSPTDWVWGAGPAVRVDVLAKAMIKLAMEGRNERIIENSAFSEIVK